MKPLVDRQLAEWRRGGVLHLREAIPSETASNLARWADELLEAPEVPGRHMVYYEDSVDDPSHRIVQRIENFVPFHDGFAEFCRGSMTLAIVAQLFGEPAVLFKDKINLKLPGGGGFKPHQDHQAGWWRYADLFISVLVPIDEATLENGCLEVVRGHHKRGMIGKEWAPMDDEEMAGMIFEPLPGKPGDLIIFDSFVPHGSQANRTSTARRALYLTYNRVSDGDWRAKYFEDKRSNFPPDIERDPDVEYTFRV
jgi:hypothetical protein